MKIIGLQSTNIKRLKAVELKLDGKGELIIVSGKNAQGKTSLLDSIWMALGGTKTVPKKPIREGATEAEIVLDIKGEKMSFQVKRTFTEKDNYLTITNEEGAKYSNPQEMLNYLIGNLSFDPLAFTRLTNKEQIKQLMDITGLDFEKDDEEIKELREQRTVVGREGKALVKIEDEAMPGVEKSASIGEVSVAELSDKYHEAVNRKYEYDKRVRRYTEIDTEIDELTKKLEVLNKEKTDLSHSAVPDDDLLKMKEELDNVESNNETFREAKALLEAHDKYTAKKKEYEGMTDDIKVKEDAKAKKLAEAKMPIDNLLWDEEGVKYDGIPFDQLSGAEQLKVSMAIAMATNPKLRVVLIKDGSLLDKEGLESIMHLAKEKDFQIWCEKVDDSGEMGIYIEDGIVKKNNKK